MAKHQESAVVRICVSLIDTEVLDDEDQETLQDRDHLCAADLLIDIIKVSHFDNDKSKVGGLVPVHDLCGDLLELVSCRTLEFLVQVGHLCDLRPGADRVNETVNNKT